MRNFGRSIGSKGWAAMCPVGCLIIWLTVVVVASVATTTVDGRSDIPWDYKAAVDS